MHPPAALPVAASASALDLARLGPSPLIPSDDSARYEALLIDVSAHVRPRGPVEEAWVRDVVDLMWEARRLRRHKAALMTAGADEGMWKLLWSLNVPGALDLSRRWAARELAAVGEVEALLAAAGLGIDHVMARTLAERIDEIERIDRMTASVELRRSATLREIGHHRATLGADLRAIADADIADAEFQVVAPAPAHDAAAAPAQPTAGCVG